MAEKPLRIALVGAGTLLGKALNDELSASSFAAADIRLLDDEDAFGKLAATADEVTFIQHIDANSFDGCDFVFFACDPEITRKHWRTALDAGASIVDLSGELENTPGVLVRAPWLQENSSEALSAQATPGLETRAVVSAHPAAVLLAIFATQCSHAAPLRSFWATLLQPASEYGHGALEELHQQTASLLSFQSLPTEVFGGQSAFSLAVSFPAEGRANLSSVADTVRRHAARIAPEIPLALQLVQVPVFHGYAVSAAVEFTQPLELATLRRSLSGPHLQVITQASEFPGHVQAVEADTTQVLLQPVMDRQEASSGAPSSRFWVWIVADNLKLAARNAIACAAELNRLRPRGGVQ